MQLKVRRQTKTKDAILGRLETGSFSCFTLENLALAIPAGEYAVEITYSPHFRRPMPLLDGVTGRNSIRIHPANEPSELEGCIAVGVSPEADSLDESDKAFEPLFTLILDAIKRGETVTVAVTDEIQPSAPNKGVQSDNPPMEADRYQTAAPVPAPRPGNTLSLALDTIQKLRSLFSRS